MLKKEGSESGAKGNVREWASCWGGCRKISLMSEWGGTGLKATWRHDAGSVKPETGSNLKYWEKAI